ncbi:hypothetical protein BS47DRAFT_1363573 [Hydnum rufescens UP504]|uniref:Threonine/serine exporter-like N-terminal domain-containing protein n=1 Tax=Hydnum rufescens UP504 TaxID=1448309 RepID=A0A9P6AVX7_9AGAM|nr:hypothetical protein BS47DRAFT_1363573 [Hydnum rufescens UP504]
MSKANNEVGPEQSSSDCPYTHPPADHFGDLVETTNPASKLDLNTLDDPLGQHPEIEHLGIKAEFSLLPTVIFAFFGDNTGKGSTMHVIKEPGGLDVLEAVTQNQMSAYVGAKALRTIHEADDTYGRKMKCLFAFLCGFIITLFAFQGAAADALIGGLCAAGMAVLSLYLASENPLIAKIFELLGAFVISFIARALYSNSEHKFCYSAIASGGIVLILPGFTVMSAALEIATKVLLTGSMKIVFAIFRALFLGFVQTLGSDLYLRIDSFAMQQRISMISEITKVVYSHGILSNSNGTTTIPMTIGISMGLNPDLAYPQFNYQGTGCYRDQGLAMLSWVERKTVIVMVMCAGAAYAANTFGGQHLTGAIGSTLGAFAVGVCGNAYARIFKAPAYVLMVPGVLLLVPTGLTAVGGLSKNYSAGNDQFESGLNTGLAMIKGWLKKKLWFNNNRLSLANFLIYVQWWRLFCFFGLFKRWKRENEIKERRQSKALFTF